MHLRQLVGSWVIRWQASFLVSPYIIPLAPGCPERNCPPLHNLLLGYQPDGAFSELGKESAQARLPSVVKLTGFHLVHILPITAPYSHSNFGISSLSTFYFNILWLSNTDGFKFQYRCTLFGFLLLTDIVDSHKQKREEKCLIFILESTTLLFKFDCVFDSFFLLSYILSKRNLYHYCKMANWKEIIKVNKGQIE